MDILPVYYFLFIHILWQHSTVYRKLEEKNYFAKVEKNWRITIRMAKNHKCLWKAMLHAFCRHELMGSNVALMMLSLVYTSTLNGLRTTCEWFMNQMRVCVDRTANLSCAIHEWFTYHSLRTEICWFFAQTQRELDVPGVLSMHPVSFACLRFVEN